MGVCSSKTGAAKGTSVTVGVKRAKIGVVGAGQIGGIVALLGLTKKLGDVVLFDVVEGLPQGKAMDLNQMATAEDLPYHVTGTNSMADMKGCDVIIVTAGVPRKPGMSRDDLLKVNKGISQSVAKGIKENGGEPFCIITTNPLDVMVMEFQEASGLPASKVVGMAGILDVGRYKYFLSERLNCASKDIRAQLLGGHGDLMVPLPSHTSVNGIPISTYIDNGDLTQEELDAICQRTRVGGGEIVNLLKTGSAFNAPAAACVEMAQSFLLDEKRTLPCCAQLKGQYGYRDIYGGVPIIIGSKGVESIVKLDITIDEQKQFDNSMQGVKELRAACAKL